MKCVLLRQALLALIVLNPSSDAKKDAISKNDLVLTIRCPQKKIKQGDEIPIIFTITNKGLLPHSYDLREHDRSGRMWEYELVAKHRDGTKVPDPRDNYVGGLGGGLSGGMGTIRTGQSFSRKIALNRWALIKAPGKYTVTGMYNYDIRVFDPTNKTVSGIAGSKKIKVTSEPVEIVVKSHSRWRMGRYIKSLVKNLKAIKPSSKWEIVQQRKVIIAKLAYTCDYRIVPTLLDLMYSNHHRNEVFWAGEAFLYLPEDSKIKKVLLHEAMIRGPAPGMQFVLERRGCTEQEFKDIIVAGLNSENPDILNETVLAAQEHPDDAHMPPLISIAMDTNKASPHYPFAMIERSRAIYAIAYNRTDEGVTALRALLKDRSKEIRRTTREAIRSAYRRHLEYPKLPDDEYTLALVPVALDFNHPMHIPAIIGICRSRAVEGVEALKELAEDPGRDIPIARTDAGVRAIWKLLRNPDEDIPRTTKSIIEGIYKEYPGRPLRNDDFPEEFRGNPIERKKEILEKIANK